MVASKITLVNTKLIIVACDAANDGFDYIYTKDPKTAAQNVQCIHTSYYFGTAIRNQCHQDWLMGKGNISELVYKIFTF